MKWFGISQKHRSQLEEAPTADSDNWSTKIILKAGTNYKPLGEIGTMSSHQ